MENNGLGGETQGKGARPRYYVCANPSERVLGARTDTELSLRELGRGMEKGSIWCDSRVSIIITL